MGKDAENKAVVGAREIILFPSMFDGNEYSEFQTLTGQYKRQEGRIARTDTEQEAKAIESVDDNEVAAVVDFFDEIVSDRHCEILRKAQYLRSLTDDLDSSFDVYNSKGDLADRYGYDAYYIANLVSSGYFDEGRFFRSMYDVIQEEKKNPIPCYREEFELIVGEKLVATFVSSDDDVHEVHTDIKSAMMKYFRYQPRSEFFDVCGLGNRCERKINIAVEDICEQYPALKTEGRDRGEERVERLYPDTIQNFEIG